METDPHDGSQKCAQDDSVSLVYALSVALAAEYVIDQVNSNLTTLAVPEIKYGNIIFNLLFANYHESTSKQSTVIFSCK